MVTQANNVQFTGNKLVMNGWTFEMSVETNSCECCGTSSTVSWDAYNRELLRREAKEVVYSFFGFETLQQAINAVQLFETARGIVNE